MPKFITVLLILGAIYWIVRRVASANASSRGIRKTPARPNARQNSPPGRNVPPPRDPYGESGREPEVQLPPPIPMDRQPVLSDAEHLVDMIRVGESASTREAVAGLVDMGDDALRVLRRAVQDTAPYVRYHAEVAMREIMARSEPDVAVTERGPHHHGVSRAETPEQDRPRSSREPRPSAPQVELPDPVILESRKSEPAPAAAPEPPVEPELPVPDVQPSMGADVVAETLRTAASATTLGGERVEVLAPLQGATVVLPMTITDVRRTTAFGIAADYLGGATVAGRVGGTDVVVAVRLPKHQATAEDLVEGAEIHVQATFVSWETLYDRGLFEGVRVGAA